MQPTEQVLFESPPVGRIRALTWGAAALIPPGLLWSSFILQHMTAHEDSPELASLTARIVMAICVSGFCIGLFAAMALYLTYYTTRLTQLAGGLFVEVETLRLFGRHVRTLPVSQIASASWHRGKVDYASGQSVDAPWFWVKVTGDKGFLLDAQGQFFDDKVLDALLTANGAAPLKGHAWTLVENAAQEREATGYGPRKSRRRHKS